MNLGKNKNPLTTMVKKKKKKLLTEQILLTNFIHSTVQI